MTDASTPETETPPEPTEHTEPTKPWLTLADGLPGVIDTDAGLRAYCEALAAGTGPVAIDAERASGYRYSGRAYLIQLRRTGSGTALIDPVAFTDMTPLVEALHGTEWILHAATQDLPCLTELGLHPSALFDTELAGRLLGYPRVGLATLVESVLGFRLRKEHSAVDWSTRPLPEPWLEYAALDVEALVELREALALELEQQGKAEWARQEFEHLRGFAPPVRVDPWRRTSGLHRVRGRRSLAAVRELWEARDAIARERDVSPSRIVPDSAIVVAAQALPTSKSELFETAGFHGRGARRYAGTWVDALQRAADLDEEALPPRSPRGDGPPPPRAWAEKDPVAAARLSKARARLSDLSDEHRLPVENLLTPDTVRRLLWAPPATRDSGALLDGVVDQLSGAGARNWQIALTAPVLVASILDADADAEAAAESARADQSPESPGSPGLTDGEPDSA